MEKVVKETWKDQKNRKRETPRTGIELNAVAGRP